jgi:hypothetical protein
MKEKTLKVLKNKTHGIKTKSSISNITNIIAIIKKFISILDFPEPNKWLPHSTGFFLLIKPLSLFNKKLTTINNEINKIATIIKIKILKYSKNSISAWYY